MEDYTIDLKELFSSLVLLLAVRMFWSFGIGQSFIVKSQVTSYRPKYSDEVIHEPQMSSVILVLAGSLKAASILPWFKLVSKDI